MVFHPLPHAPKCLFLFWLGGLCLPGMSQVLADEPYQAPYSSSSAMASESRNADRASRYESYAEPRRSRPQPTYSSNGNYRQPVDIVFVDAQSALVTTKLTGELYELQYSPTGFAQSKLSLIYRDPACSFGTVIPIVQRQLPLQYQLDAPASGSPTPRISGDGKDLKTTTHSLAQRADIVAITERNAEQVVLFHRLNGTWRKSVSFDVPGQAHSLAWDAEQQTLIASGLWSQQLYRWQWIADDATQEKSWRRLPPVDLRMCGGELLILPKHDWLLITDPFGSNYRLLNRTTGEVIKSDKVYGHNISGLASVHDETLVLFPHQLLSATAQSVRNEITWGGVLSNNLRWLQLDRMRDLSGHDIMRKGRFYPLGTNGDGCGDPSSLAVSSTGLLAITLGGTNRVALGQEHDYYFRQVAVGMHPVSCQFSPDEQALVVVNQFSDSLSIVSLSDDRVQQLSLGELRPPTIAERGEQAFFDSTLSHDGWMSCHSCHSQGHTSGQLNDNFTDRSFGTPKRILSLLGQSETAPYSWNGHMQDLESQVAHSIRSTMASDHKVESDTVADIAAYVRSLPAPPSLTQARLPKSREISVGAAVAVKPPKPSLARIKNMAGERLFAELNCTECHRERWLTSSDSYDVGLVDEAQQTLFNPPSLIAVSQRQDVLLHDGRATSLSELFEQHQHQLPRALTPDEYYTLISYLESL